MKNRVLFLMMFLLFAGMVSGQEVDEEIEAMRPPRLLGKQAPQIEEAKWINKKPESRNGRLTLLHFWSPTQPMAAYVDIPRFNKFAKEFADKLQVIGLSPDEPDFIMDIEPMPEYPYASTPKTVEKYGVTTLCYCYVLDPDGKVVHECFSLLKGEAITEDLLKELIKKYYKGK